MMIQRLKLSRYSTIWTLSIFGIYYCLEIINAAMDNNNEERSQRGMALLNHTYKSFYAEDYHSCLMACMQEPRCTSLNYGWYSSQCDLNNKTKYSAETSFFSQDAINTYMGLLREPDINRSVYRSCRHVHPSNGDGEYLIDPTLSGNPFTVYCDMTTDGGGWTAIQKISFTESNLFHPDQASRYYMSNYKDLSTYYNHSQKVTSASLLQLRNDMGFKQIRFYCYKKKVGTVFHIMTNLNPLGEAVVAFFTDQSQTSTRPQACGSYTVLPDDNSTLSGDCNKLGWNDTHPDGKWFRKGSVGTSRLLKALRRIDGPEQGSDYQFYSMPGRRSCDDSLQSDISTITAGDSWAVFVR